MEPEKEILRWARRLWFRDLRRRFQNRAVALAAGALLAYALLVHGLVQTGSSVLPTPSGLLRTALALVLLAAIASAILALSRRFSGFLRYLDRDLGWGERLATWRDLEKRGERNPIAALFVENLRRDCLKVDLRDVFAETSPRWPRYASLGAALLYLLLLWPWGGGLVSGGAGGEEPNSNPASERAGLYESGDRLGAAVGAGEGARPQSDAKEPAGPENPVEGEPPPPPPYEIEAKFVPGQSGSGPTTLKEVLTYDLPAAGRSGGGAEDRSAPLSEKYPELRRAAEEAIRRDLLDPEEARFVVRYFDRIRPP